jgi:hypothetical protein
MRRLQAAHQAVERGVQRCERLLEMVPDIVAGRLQARAPRLAAAIRCIHIDSPLTTLFLACT